MIKSVTIIGGDILLYTSVIINSKMSREFYEALDIVNTSRQVECVIFFLNVIDECT